MKVANPAKPVNGQDERASPAVDSPARFCSPAVKWRQPKVLPPLTIIKGNYQPAFMEESRFSMSCAAEYREHIEEYIRIHTQGYRFRVQI